MWNEHAICSIANASVDFFEEIYLLGMILGDNLTTVLAEDAIIHIY